MTAQTSRYGIQYPTGSDLVSNIPQHMQNAANSIEQALADVDDRHTTAAYSPVVRKNKAELDSAGGQPGQIGIVTAESNQALNMYYIRGTFGWVRIFTDTKAGQLFRENIMQVASVLWHLPASDSNITLARIGQIVFASGSVKFNYTGQLNHSAMSEKIPAGYRPAYDNATILTSGNTWISFLIKKDGSVVILGDPKSQYAGAFGAWITNDPYPAN